MLNKTPLQKKNKILAGNVLVVALLVVSAALGLVYVKEGKNGPLHAVQNAVGMVVSPLQFVGSGVAHATETAGEAVQDATVDDATYAQLQEENAQLKAQLAQMEEYRLEAQRLEGLLGLTDKYQLEGVTGSVIGRNADAWNRVITVNVGSKSGVEPGLPVIGSSGVVGQVIKVTPMTCKVRLLTDPQSGVSVITQTTRVEGVVKGSVEGLLYLENVDPSEEIAVGDAVITSGLGGTYYRGLAIGTVVNVINAAGTADRTIVVSPFSSADPLEEVIVVTGMNSQGDLSGDASSDVQDGE